MDDHPSHDQPPHPGTRGRRQTHGDLRGLPLTQRQAAPAQRYQPGQGRWHHHALAPFADRLCSSLSPHRTQTTPPPSSGSATARIGTDQPSPAPAEPPAGPVCRHRCCMADADVGSRRQGIHMVIWSCFHLSHQSYLQMYIWTYDDISIFPSVHGLVMERPGLARTSPCRLLRRSPFSRRGRRHLIPPPPEDGRRGRPLPLRQPEPIDPGCPSAVDDAFWSIEITGNLSNGGVRWSH